MMVTATPFESGSAPKIPKNPDTISLAQASVIKENIVAIAPPTMNGRRFPYLLRDLSLRNPTYG